MELDGGIGGVGGSGARRSWSWLLPHLARSKCHKIDQAIKLGHALVAEGQMPQRQSGFPGRLLDQGTASRAPIRQADPRAEMLGHYLAGIALMVMGDLDAATRHTVAAL